MMNNTKNSSMKMRVPGAKEAIDKKLSKIMGMFNEDTVFDINHDTTNNNKTINDNNNNISNNNNNNHEDSSVIDINRLNTVNNEETLSYNDDIPFSMMRDLRNNSSFFSSFQLDSSFNDYPLIISQKIYTRPTFIVRRVEKKERLDYVLKRFKRNVIKHYITSLNKTNKDLHFYLPDYKHFTSNIKYRDNYNMFQISMEEIIKQYGNKNKGSNEKKLKRLNNLRFTFYPFLKKTYKTIIMEYFGSKEYKQDIERMDNDFEKRIYETLGDKTSGYNFISLMESGRK